MFMDNYSKIFLKSKPKNTFWDKLLQSEKELQYTRVAIENSFTQENLPMPRILEFTSEESDWLGNGVEYPYSLQKMMYFPIMESDIERIF